MTAFLAGGFWSDWLVFANDSDALSAKTDCRRGCGATVSFFDQDSYLKKWLFHQDVEEQSEQHLQDPDVVQHHAGKASLRRARTKKPTPTSLKTSRRVDLLFRRGTHRVQPLSQLQASQSALKFRRGEVDMATSSCVYAEVPKSLREDFLHRCATTVLHKNDVPRTRSQSGYLPLAQYNDEDPPAYDGAALAARHHNSKHRVRSKSSSRFLFAPDPKDGESLDHAGANQDKHGGQQLGDTTAMRTHARSLAVVSSSDHPGGAVPGQRRRQGEQPPTDASTGQRRMREQFGDDEEPTSDNSVVRAGRKISKEIRVMLSDLSCLTFFETSIHTAGYVGMIILAKALMTNGMPYPLFLIFTDQIVCCGAIILLRRMVLLHQDRQETREQQASMYIAGAAGASSASSTSARPLVGEDATSSGAREEPGMNRGGFSVDGPMFIREHSGTASPGTTSGTTPRAATSPLESWIGPVSTSFSALREVLPLSVLNVGTGATGMASNLFLFPDVTEAIQMTGPVFQIPLSFFVQGEKFSTYTLLSLLPLCVGGVLCSVGEVNFNSVGMTLAIVCVGFRAGRMLFTAVLVDKKANELLLAGRGPGERLVTAEGDEQQDEGTSTAISTEGLALEADEIATRNATNAQEDAKSEYSPGHGAHNRRRRHIVLDLALLALPVNATGSLLMSLLFEGRAPWIHVLQHPWAWQSSVILLKGFSAACWYATEFLLIEERGAVFTSIIANVNRVCCIATDLLVFHNPVSLIQAGGFALTAGGLSSYLFSIVGRDRKVGPSENAFSGQEVVLEDVVEHTGSEGEENVQVIRHVPVDITTGQAAPRDVEGGKQTTKASSDGSSIVAEKQPPLPATDQGAVARRTGMGAPDDSQGRRRAGQGSNPNTEEGQTTGGGGELKNRV
ncbi:unnamed protein product [Amoebophrya sp. A120]|nr:unnamed protein product [Amoebophrya sp. A120]|eukprot:GSA120T00001713001.1